MKLIVLKKSLITALALSTVVVMKASAQEKITLQRAIDLTLERNLTIKQAQFTEALSNEDYKQSKNNLLPSLSASSQGSYNFGRSPNLTTYSYTSQSFLYVNGQAQASVILFQGGQLRNQILQNRILLDANKSNTAKVKNDLVLSVVTNFLSVLTNQDLVAAAQQQIDIAKITLDRTQKSFDAGNATLADLSQAKAQQSTADLNMTNAQNQLALTLLTLKQYMEMNPATEIVIERPDVAKINDIKTAYANQEVINTALNVNPDIRLAETQQRAYAQAVKVARAAYLPVLSLFGSIGSNYSSISQNVVGVTTVTQQIGTVQGTNTPVFGQFQSAVYSPSYSLTSQFSNNFNQSVGLNLQIPIFNRYLARTSVRKAQLNYKNAEVSTQLAKNNLAKTISQALLDLQAADRKYQSAQQTYQANKDAFNVVQQRYNVGLVNSLDYNTSLNNLNKSQNDMILARYELIFRSKVIDYYLGNPITL
ncbi:TolC family protein [Mucilaginibacter sp. RS28]|uniref:TolC family protein n=1 Tax=Mucilaginibacter straminoryzae TaxID=2932774 RepID=A0A9X1X6P0_9SPHI|nr:TolC family protein [Mucilaginibacter straminoryzae]MCJ8211931.1 TolC family protein [Mucilaginibacter straminoryzae]